MIVKLLTKHHLAFLSLEGCCRGSSESTHVKMPHCWKSNALAQMYWVKTLLHQGISEPIFYGDLVDKFKRIVGKSNFSDRFKKIVNRYIKVGNNLDIIRQSAYMALNPITVMASSLIARRWVRPQTL